MKKWYNRNIVMFNKYLYAFRNSWLLHLEYRLDSFTTLLVSAISLLSIFYLWNDVFAGKAALMGFTKPEIVTYYVIVGYLFAGLWVYVPISDEIREGELSIFLTKPMNYLLYSYFKSLARRSVRLVLGLPILASLFWIFRGHLYFVPSIRPYLLLIVTSFFAVNIMYLIDVAVACLEFWVKYSNSANFIFDAVTRLFAGTLIPLAFLPGYVQSIGTYLPFKYTGHFLISAFLGRIGGADILFGVAMQLAWTAALVILVRLIWRAGLKRYEAFGS